MDERKRLTVLALLVLVPQFGLAAWLYGGRLFAFAEVIPACDFAVFYSGGTLARAGNLVGAYDPEVYQSTMRDVAFDAGKMFWFYPPPMALVASAFSSSTYWRGLVLWLALGTAAWALAAYRLDGRRGVLAMVAFPPTVIVTVYAQASLWLAPLLSEGLRLLEDRPLVAGALFGVLSLKPHWLLVVLVALIAGRHVRALASTIATSALLASLSVAAYGMEPWHAWLASVASALQWVSLMAPQDVVSPYSAVPAVVAPTVQAFATFVGFASTIWVFARRNVHDLRMAVVPIAMSLTSPYMHFYDLVALGIPALVIGRRLEAAGQPLLPYASLVGASLWLCRVVGALFDVQPYPLFALVALAVVLNLGRTDASVPTANVAGL